MVKFQCDEIPSYFFVLKGGTSTKRMETRFCTDIYLSKRCEHIVTRFNWLKTCFSSHLALTYISLKTCFISQFSTFMHSTQNMFFLIDLHLSALHTKTRFSWSFYIFMHFTQNIFFLTILHLYTFDSKHVFPNI